MKMIIVFIIKDNLFLIMCDKVLLQTVVDQYIVTNYRNKRLTMSQIQILDILYSFFCSSKFKESTCKKRRVKRREKRRKNQKMIVLIPQIACEEIFKCLISLWIPKSKNKTDPLLEFLRLYTDQIPVFDHNWISSEYDDYWSECFEDYIYFSQIEDEIYWDTLPNGDNQKDPDEWSIKKFQKKQQKGKTRWRPDRRPVPKGEGKPRRNYW